MVYRHVIQSKSYLPIKIERVVCVNIPDAVLGSAIRVTDNALPVRVSIALIHTVTTPSISFTVYVTGSNPTRITAINHNHCYMHSNIPYRSINGILKLSVSSQKYLLYKQHIGYTCAIIDGNSCKCICQLNSWITGL